MKLETKARYPVSSDVVIKMFCDPEFHSKKLEAMGMTDSRVLDHSGDGGEFRIKVERKVPIEAPGPLKKFFGAKTTVVHEEKWSASNKTGKVKVQPSGVPVEINCSASMSDNGAEGIVSYTWDIKAKVPLIGGVLEKFVASDMEKRLHDETKAAAGLAGQYT